MVRNPPDSASARVPTPPHLTQPALQGLERRIDDALMRHAQRVVLDLSDLQSIDSAALNWLLVMQERLATAGVTLQLEEPSPLCRDVLIATRLESRFKLAAGPERGDA